MSKVKQKPEPKSPDTIAAATGGVVQTLRLSQITTDPTIQCRTSTNDKVVEAYADAMGGGAEFPPVVAFREGDQYLLADGFHRYAAAQKSKAKKIRVEVRQGGRRDALLFAAAANSTHGLQRTNADKRRAVLRLLEDAEWAKWSNREIARRCGVGDQLVATLRDSRRVNHASRKFFTRHGTVGERPVSGSKPRGAAPRPQPGKEHRESTEPLDDPPDSSDPPAEQWAVADAEEQEICWFESADWPPEPSMEDHLSEATRATERLLEYDDHLAVADDAVYDRFIATHQKLMILHRRIMSRRAATAAAS